MSNHHGAKERNKAELLAKLQAIEEEKIRKATEKQQRKEERARKKREKQLFEQLKRIKDNVFSEVDYVTNLHGVTVGNSNLFGVEGVKGCRFLNSDFDRWLVPQSVFDNLLHSKSRW